jgi:hypothetical protein
VFYTDPDSPLEHLLAVRQSAATNNRFRRSTRLQKNALDAGFLSFNTEQVLAKLT